MKVLDQAQTLLSKAERAEVADILPDLSTRVMYFLMAFVLLLVPSYLFHGVVGLDAEENVVLYVAVAFFSSCIMTFAYQNVMMIAKAFLTGPVSSAFGSASPASIARRNGSGDEYLERQRRADNESRWFAMFAVNGSYLAAVLLCAFVFFRKMTPGANCALSLSLPASFLSVVSAVFL